MTKAELDALRQTNIEIANRIYDYEIESPHELESSQEPQRFIVVYRSVASLGLRSDATYTRQEAEHIARNLRIEDRESRIFEVDDLP
tara:strand:+ start:1986 stop:2246 length:261 start_codon:yes stop_codon:yes gene_type:complete